MSKTWVKTYDKGILYQSEMLVDMCNEICKVFVEFDRVM